MKLLFLDGTGGFYPARLQEKPTGGILTSLTLIPQYLAAHGMEVYVLSDYEKDEIYNGVHYIKRPIEKNIWDIVVLNRNMLNREVTNFFKDSKKIWWLHDIVDYRYCTDDAFTAVDHVVALSRYCRDSFSNFYSINLNKFSIIPNGIDPSIFYQGAEKRNKNLYICASAPIKGTYPLEFTLNNLKRYSSDFEIRLYSGRSLHDIDLTDSMNRQLSYLSSIGVNVLDPVSQKELSRVMRSAWAFLMPGHYPEICSNLVLQALACGLPVIGTPIGSLPEFVVDGVNGLLTKTLPHDMFWWHKDYAEQCIKMRLDSVAHDRMAAAAPNGILSWSDVGGKWLKLLRERIWERQSTINTHPNLILAEGGY